MNVVAQFLVIGGYAETLRTNSDPYVYPFLMITPRTKRFVREVVRDVAHNWNNWAIGASPG